MLGLLDLFLVDLRQTIDIVVATLDAKVLCQVDNLDILRDGMLFKECLALAVSEAEEYHVHLVKRHLVRKLQFCFAYQAFVNVRHQIACVALAIGKHNLCLGMVQQQANQFSARIACST